MKALACLAVLVATASVAAGCGSSNHAGARRAPTHADPAARTERIHVSLAGVSPSGADVGYIATPEHWNGGPPPRIELSHHARLPFRAQRGPEHAAESYYVNAGVLGPGHIACTIRIGRVSDTGWARGPDSLCVAGLMWSGGLGRWVNGRPGSSRFISG